MGETLGYGGLSTTRKCYHKMTGEIRAVKVTKKEELGGALIYLASEASSSVVGHNLVVDGGWTVW